MARIKSLSIQGYRSIKDKIVIDFPLSSPLALIGENNAGKSNIIRALDVILGETWPESRDPEDHEFWNRDPSNSPIDIYVSFLDFDAQNRYGKIFKVDKFQWSYNALASGKKCKFRAISKGKEEFITNEMRENCMCVVIGADRRLSYQLSYQSKWTLLSKLMRKFHSKLRNYPDSVEQLKKKFEEIVEIFHSVKEFARFKSGLSQKFGEMFAGMSYGLQIDFSAYDPSNYFHSLRVLPDENGNIRTLEELGTGQEQLLALVFAHAYAKAFYGGIILVIEEPEAHLHPLAQQWLAKKINEMANDGLQIMIETHSPAFMDILNIEGIVLVRKKEGVTYVTQLNSHQLAEYCKTHGSHPQRTNKDSILPFYKNASTQEIMQGFFAKKVVLVEGQSESLALPIFLKKAGLDVTKEGIAIVPVIGKGNLAKWWRLFTAYGIPTYIIFDNDDKHDPDKKRRIDALRTLGIQDDAKIERIVNYDNWGVTGKFTVFGNDFETTLRTYFKEYSSLEEQAKRDLGDSKPLIAQYVANNIQYDNENRGWQNFKRMVEVIRRLNLQV